jgi:hypothetical protein
MERPKRYTVWTKQLSMYLSSNHYSANMRVLKFILILSYLQIWTSAEQSLDVKTPVNASAATMFALEVYLSFAQLAQSEWLIC